MANLNIELNLPLITPEQGLTGWHREFCVELLADRSARVFVRTVERGSSKAAELRRAILFRRLDPRFSDLADCITTLRHELDHLADTGRRVRPESTNLFRALEYDRACWERVERAVDRWGRR